MKGMLVLLLGVALPGCVERHVFIADVRPGPRGSLIVSRCTLQTTQIIWSMTGFTDCKEGIVRAAYVEPAASEKNTPCREVADDAAHTYGCGCTPKDQAADGCKTHTPDGSPR